MKILKKITFILLSSIAFYGCDAITPTSETIEKVKAKNVDSYEVSNEGVQILIIDSCEYIWCKDGYGAGLTHKGNCKFCLKRNN